MANLKLSPMTAYKVRKILLNQAEHNHLLSSSTESAEASLDIDKLLVTLYLEDERILKIQELEALATCYQNLSSSASAYSPEVQELKKQILSILQPHSRQGVSSFSSSLSDPSAQASFEARWFSRSNCHTNTDILKFLNALLQFSTRYIGPQIARRMIMTAMSDEDLASQFSIDEKGAMSFSGVDSSPILSTDLKLIQDWVTAYIEFCSSIISSFRELVSQDFAKRFS